MTRKAPTRTCIACGTAADKRELLRLVRMPDGHVEVDTSGKAPGRGAYICMDMGCFEQARKRKMFDRALRTKLDVADYDRLEEDFRTLCTAGTQTCSRDGE